MFTLHENRLGWTRTAAVLLFCLLLFVCVRSAAETTSSTPWADVGERELREKEVALSHSLEKMLADMPGISRARVHVTLKDTRLLSRNPQRDSAVAVVLWRNGSGGAIDEHSVQKLLLATVPDVSVAHVSIHTFSEPENDPDPARRADNWIDREARTVIVALLAVCAVLAAGWIRLGLQGRKRRRTPLRE